VKGALERVLQRCTHFVSSFGMLVPLQDSNRKAYMHHEFHLGRMGLRGSLNKLLLIVVGFCFTLKDTNAY
jgi:hypothetical protein